MPILVCIYSKTFYYLTFRILVRENRMSNFFAICICEFSCYLSQTGRFSNFFLCRSNTEAEMVFNGEPLDMISCFVCFLAFWLRYLYYNHKKKKFDKNRNKKSMKTNNRVISSHEIKKCIRKQKKKLEI